MSKATTKITEEWARTAPAGSELDLKCALWFGYRVVERVEYGVKLIRLVMDDPPDGLDSVYCIEIGTPCGETYPMGDEHADTFPPKFSTDWSAAGPLLEAMGADLLRYDGKWACEVQPGSAYPAPILAEAEAPTPQLAIARICAVLFARGITRENLEDA